MLARRTSVGPAALALAAVLAAAAPAWADAPVPAPSPAPAADRAPTAPPAPAAPPVPYDGPAAATAPQAVDTEPPPPPGTVKPAVDEERPRRRPVQQRAPDTRPPKESAIIGEFGLGAPVGMWGVEGLHHLGSFGEISVGLGFGNSALQSGNSSLIHALQWAVMPRLRLGNDFHAFTIGVGVSGGQFGKIPIFICIDQQGPCTYPTRYAFWSNLEFGGEHLWPSGFAMRYFAGYAKGCTTNLCVAGGLSGQDMSFPYFGIGIGFGF
jgi:hypothetical protein